MRPNAVALRTVGGIQEITWAEYGQRVEATGDIGTLDDEGFLTMSSGSPSFPRPGIRVVTSSPRR